MKKIVCAAMLVTLVSVSAAGVLLYAAEEPADTLQEATAAPVEQPAPSAAEKVIPKKVEVDSDFDGKVDRTETYDTNGQISRIEVDSNADGKIDEWITYENGKPVQTQRDSNSDGKVDVWIEY